ncbi:hypothetical protein CVN76_08335 [Bacillus sp. mrc49]|nr:hypothetical protein CVN76_08335 [Bacillus sp. mrc49]
MSNKKLRRLSDSGTGVNSNPESSSRDAFIKILNDLLNDNKNISIKKIKSIKKPKSIKKFR